LHALGVFADRLGVGDLLSARVPVTGERLRLHDRGKVLTQAMLMLAGGGEACADIEHLRSQPELFGSVPSDSTLYRTFRDIDPATLGALWEALAEVRAQVWRRSAATTGTATVVLDIDSSLHEIHSENKQDTAATYKGGFGFHPIYCFADATGETLAVRLRPGNAGANDIADHVAVLDAALAQRPEEIAVGHRPGDDPTRVRRGCRCAPTRGAAAASCGAAANATSGSRWWPAPTRLFTPLSAVSRGTTTPGARRCVKTATNGMAQRWPSSPIWSTCPTGRTALG
jgi:hypothetical protein